MAKRLANHFLGNGPWLRDHDRPTALLFLITSNRGQQYVDTLVVLGFAEYALLVAGMLAGFAVKRKLFAILILLESTLSGVVTLWSNCENLRDAFPDILLRSFSPKTYVALTDWSVLSETNPLK